MANNSDTDEDDDSSRSEGGLLSFIFGGRKKRRDEEPECRCVIDYEQGTHSNSTCPLHGGRTCGGGRG